MPRVRHGTNHHQRHNRIGALVSATICRAAGIVVQRDVAILQPSIAIAAYPQQGHKHCADDSARIFHSGCLLFLNTWHITSGGNIQFVACHGGIRHSRCFTHCRNQCFCYQTPHQKGIIINASNILIF